MYSNYVCTYTYTHQIIFQKHLCNLQVSSVLSLDYPFSKGSSFNLLFSMVTLGKKSLKKKKSNSNSGELRGPMSFSVLEVDDHVLLLLLLLLLLLAF